MHFIKAHVYELPKSKIISIKKIMPQLSAPWYTYVYQVGVPPPNKRQPLK